VRWKKRDYRIFKKTTSADGSWYYMSWKEGKRDPINLQTPELSTAEVKLKLLLEAMHDGKLAKMRAVPEGRADASTPLVLVEKYLEKYELTATGTNTPQNPPAPGDASPLHSPARR
jgi:hypothetical protein